MVHTTVMHELGHVLGLDHIGCNTNEDKCYGKLNTPDYRLYGEGQ